MRRIAAAFIVALLVCIDSAGATAGIRLPLEGYFRAGRCMPVMVDENPAGVTIRAEGVIPTEVAAGRNGVVPVLMLGSNIQSLEGITLRALTPNERLVGSTTGQLDLARQLFPEATIIPVRLDPSRPLPGPSLAWEALDAVILDTAPDPAQLPELAAMGIVVAVVSERQPDARWPWQRVGDAWVLRLDLAGPDRAIAGPTAYLPTMSWHRGVSPALRRRIVLGGVLVSLVVLSTLLIRSRAGIALTLLAAVLGCGAIELWRRSQPAVRRADGAILVTRGALAQVDRWTYVSAVSDARGSDASRPVLVDVAHARRAELTLRCQADGSMRWHYTLPRNNRLALMSRRVQVNVEAPLIPDASLSPLHELARQLYLRRGDQIIGAVPAPVAPDEAWMGVLIGAAPTLTSP